MKLRFLDEGDSALLAASFEFGMISVSSFLRYGLTIDDDGVAAAVVE